MKKILIFSAVIAALVLNTGCNGKDKSISVKGNWYAEYDKEGTYYDFLTDEDEAYSRVIQFYQFEDGNRGYWTEFLFREGSTYPDAQYGSLTGLEYADGAFNYTVADDGTVRISLLNYREYDPYDNIWTLKASGKKIVGTDEGVTYTLVRPTDMQIKQVRSWDDESHGGSAEDEYLYTDIDNGAATQPAE